MLSKQFIEYMVDNFLAPWRSLILLRRYGSTCVDINY